MVSRVFGASTKCVGVRCCRQAKHRDAGVVAARTYKYEDEALCDANRDLMLECVDNAAALGDDQFIAIKLTALAKPELLEKISTTLRAIKDLWIGEFGRNTTAADVDLARFTKFVGSLGVRLSAAEIGALFARLDLNNDGVVDYIEWTRLLSFESLLTRRFFETKGYELRVLQPLAASGLLPLLNEHETRLMDLFRERLDAICERAAAKHVRVMIDAEQTYMQPAIDHFARLMQQKYNHSSAIVFNTYQVSIDWIGSILFDRFSF